MSVKPKVICLCGSTKFYEEFMRANAEETLKGNIVISVGIFCHKPELYNPPISVSEADKQMLDELHKTKIDMSDEILVINKDGYIGQSTKNEIEYSKLHNKVIKYYFGE